MLLSQSSAPTQICTLSLHDALPISEDLFDVPISLGSVVRLQQATSEVLREPVQEARDFVQKAGGAKHLDETGWKQGRGRKKAWRSEEHTSELQSRFELVCRLLLEKK